MAAVDALSCSVFACRTATSLTHSLLGEFEKTTNDFEKFKQSFRELLVRI